ncbi:hypothetical protein FHX74_001967 [Friedmanniella endophytica]|uniref:Uncharacterized protein n=1 Tax=Microlunatus kandeliicorticis TaxID=1759536 RepID=A0A7W3ISB7_9ACTN|nr:hypothetical protein [Microlunatus kandeliicorticis]
MSTSSVLRTRVMQACSDARASADSAEADALAGAGLVLPVPRVSLPPGVLGEPLPDAEERAAGEALSDPLDLGQTAMVTTTAATTTATPTAMATARPRAGSA